MRDAAKFPQAALESPGFFKRTIREAGRPRGPQTSEEWWNYLCEQADERRRRFGLPSMDQIIDWRRAE